MSVDIKVSLIVAVYKDIEALDLIVQALKNQTYKNFELVIAEDNNSDEMKNFISNIKGIEVKHTFQEDIGIRKMRSLNNGILASKGEYLIFIDGDCIPYSRFIEAHIKLSEPGFVVSGRRCNLGPKYSNILRKQILSPLKLENTFIYRYPSVAYDAVERHAEAGFQVKPDGILYDMFLKNRKSTKHLLGCNYSCFRKDIELINGYDEGYGETAIGDDTDLEWRFKAVGLKLKSAKNVANIFHLYHDRSFRDKISYEKELKLLEKNKNNNVFECKQGLKQH